MFFNLIKEINRLLSKAMSNIYLKVTIDTFSELWFSGFKKFVTRSLLGISNSRTYHWILKLIALRKPINQTSESKAVGGFSILILKGVMTF